MRTSKQIKAEIEDEFGFFPPFFEPALENPYVLDNLWQQTLAAYINNPFSSVFNEKLSAYLARYCTVSYCLVCHSCSLRRLGIKGSEVLHLVVSPPPSATEIHFHLSVLKAHSHELTTLSKLNSLLEESLLRCSIFISIEQKQAEFCRQQLRHLLGTENYERLVIFVAYLKTCHLWMEAHPEILYEADKRAEEHLADLFKEESALADFFQNYVERVNREDLEKTFHLTNLTSHKSNQKLAQAAANDVRFAEAINSASDGVIIVDPHQEDKPIIYSNPAFSKITGYRPDEIIGRNWRFLQGSNTDPPMEELLRTVIAQNREVKVTLLNYRQDSHPFWNELKIYPVFSQEGELLYLVSVCADVTEKLEASGALVTAKFPPNIEFTKSPKISNTKREAWIEGIRILAVVMILLYHAQLLFTDYAFTPQPTGLIDNLQQLFTLTREGSFLEQLAHIFTIPVWFGFQFVDFFVLVSGFSLVLSLRGHQLEPIAFLKKRLLRLLWPFWTVAWLSYPVLWAIGITTNSYIPDAWHTFAAATFPLLFSVRGELLLATSGPWWFVPLIICFTLIFPVLWQLQERWGARNLLLVSTLLTIGYRALAVYVLGGHPTYVILDTPAAEQPFQIFLSKLSIFVVGMVVAQAYKQGNSPISWSDRQALLVGIPLYVLGFVCQFYWLGWVFADLLVPLGLTLICMVVSRSLSRSPRMQTLMIQLGRYSYSFFLIHNFVVDRTLNLLVKGNPRLYYLLLPVMVVGTLLLAVLADYIQPLLQRSVVAVLRDISYILTRSHIAPQRTWIPIEGDRVCYLNKPGWTVLKVERLLDAKEFYICQIAKDGQVLWVNEKKLQLDKSVSDLRETTIQPNTTLHKKGKFFANLFFKKWPFSLDKIIFSNTVIIGVPTILYYYLRQSGWTLLGLHLTIASAYLFTSLMMMYEATLVWCKSLVKDKVKAKKSKFNRFFQSFRATLGIRKFRPSQATRPLPRCSCIVVAYLPNEQDIILDTLTHILTQVQHPQSGLELILAYNSPVELPVEEELRHLAALYPELRLLRVEESKSKAENLNAAIQVVTGVITCILDADHHPCADCFVRAWQWLEHDYDVVQGRSIIRNYDDNLLTQIVAIEFESIYGVSHPAKSLLVDTAIFGGSNGYWNTSVLKRIRLNPTMLTEDIDASVRTLLQGYRITHDESIVSTELAPTKFKSFWTQRKRWAHGWLEVSLKYQRQFWKSAHLNGWQKAYWTYLLYYREFFSLIALQIYSIIFSLLLYQGYFTLWSNWYLWLTTLITLLSGVYQTLVTMQVAYIKYPLRYFLQYALLTFFYTALKHMISLVALYDHLQGQTDWVITPRQINRQAVNANS
ncbi:MAG: acyltransferase family protein [Aphanothece sp. CMT-3BRIN-NPC111]|jgi:PAS domain S-box-containing protein|nr:acyltransferase family protein [Aphanothece sp. CMT-3BRIN-NPC111]